MFRFKFNQVYVGLIALSCFSAFMVPARITNPIRNIQGLFAPIARPARAVGAALHQKFSRPPRDDRAITDVKDENRQLRQAVASLTGQLEELKRINADRQQLGDVRPLCTPMMVIGSDPGPRQSLSLGASIGEPLAAGMAVLYAGGIVGRVDRAGPGGVQVRLVTDRDFRATGRFVRYERDAAGTVRFHPLETTPPLVQGLGKGEMSVTNLPLKETGGAGVAVNDVVVLDDREWPANLRNQWLGLVVSIGSLRDAPLFADIRIRPMNDLSLLREVMVMNRVSGFGFRLSAGAN